MDLPVENSPLGVLRCEAGCQLERKLDVLLTGYVPGNRVRKSQEGVCQFVILRTSRIIFSTMRGYFEGYNSDIKCGVGNSLQKHFLLYSMECS